MLMGCCSQLVGDLSSTSPSQIKFVDLHHTFLIDPCAAQKAEQRLGRIARSAERQHEASAWFSNALDTKFNILAAVQALEVPTTPITCTPVLTAEQRSQSLLVYSIKDATAIYVFTLSFQACRLVTFGCVQSQADTHAAQPAKQLLGPNSLPWQNHRTHPTCCEQVVGRPGRRGLSSGTRTTVLKTSKQTPMLQPMRRSVVKITAMQEHKYHPL